MSNKTQMAGSVIEIRIHPADIQAIKSLVIETIEDCLQNNQSAKNNLDSNNPAQKITKKAAAALLDCSQSTIDNNARAGRLRRFYIGKSVRFLKSEVLALAKEKNKGEPGKSLIKTKRKGGRNG